MSRNSSGTYTLPSGNPVVSGTLIEATWANSTLSDIATALTGSLSRSAEGGMLASLRLFDGTSSVPGLAWGSETTTGLYRAGAGDTRLVVTGSEVQKWLSTGVAITGTLSATGNTTVGGTLAVTGASTFTGAITANGGVVGAVTGNASTATALQNARTIWGQSFNGTANVTGALTGVTDLTASGNGSFGGTLAVTGATTLSSTLAVNGATVTVSNSTAFFPQIINRNTTSDANASYLVLDKVRGSSVVQNGDVLGNLVFRGFDGTQYLQGAYINAVISAAPGTNDMPADLVFGTTADGGAGPSERMRLDKAGNLGLGVTPSAWRSTAKAIQFGFGGSVASGTASGVTYFSSNWYEDSAGTDRYINSTFASQYYQVNGSHVWRTAPSGTAGNAISFTQAMTLDASGNLALGTTSTPGRFRASGADASAIGLINGASYGVRFGSSAGVGAYVEGVDSGGVSSYQPLIVGGSDLRLATGGVERARIDSSGNLLVGTTSATSSSRLKVQGSGTTGSTTSFNVYNSAGTEMCVIADNGVFYTGKATFSPYNNTTGSAANLFVAVNGDLFRSTSSLKYKKNVTDYDKGLSSVMALRSVYYQDNRTDQNRADQTDKTYAGLIAEEVHEAGLTEFVQYAEDGTPDALAYGNMVSLCIKAIQEQQAIITALTARVAALEAPTA